MMSGRQCYCCTRQFSNTNSKKMRKKIQHDPDLHCTDRLPLYRTHFICPASRHSDYVRQPGCRQESSPDCSQNMSITHMQGTFKHTQLDNCKATTARQSNTAGQLSCNAHGQTTAKHCTQPDNCQALHTVRQLSSNVHDQTYIKHCTQSDNCQALHTARQLQSPAHIQTNVKHCAQPDTCQ